MWCRIVDYRYDIGSLHPSVIVQINQTKLIFRCSTFPICREGSKPWYLYCLFCFPVVAGRFLFCVLIKSGEEIKMNLYISLVMTWQINNEHYFQQTYEGPQHFTHEFFMWLLISNLALFYFQFQFNIWRNTLESPLQGSFN